MLQFKDNFSKQADIYARYRPHYPDSLFQYLSSLTEEHNTAWDCGTGNGQAAIALTGYYDRIIATDPSEQQIQNVTPHERIIYRIEKAEENTIADHSIDLLTIANALHWFEFDKFYSEVNRVLKPGGIIAAWSYCYPYISPETDEITKHYHDVILNEYWQYENRLVEHGYKDLPFPFDELKAPEFISEKMMDMNDFVAFLNTWSATQKFIRHRGYNPTDDVKKKLTEVWGEQQTKKKVTWKLVLKVGRIPT